MHGRGGEVTAAHPAAAPVEEDDILIGVSSCLLGAEVRYDGRHKRNAWLVDTLGRFVRFVPVCPEVELGLGTPREPIRLERAGREVRLVGVNSGTDHTEAMRAYAARRVAELARLGLAGYVLKAKSPSCGLFRVEVHRPGGLTPERGRGLFAEALASAMPGIPLEEEGRLDDPRLRDNFIARIFAFRRLERLFRPGWSTRDLAAFQAREKLLLMAHDPVRARALDRLVAEAKGREPEALAQEYRAGFMAALSRLATTRRNTHVLRHVAGRLEPVLDPATKAEIHAAIEDYHRGHVPLLVPLTLLRHHVRLHGIDRFAGQSYLEPHPKELMLRNHV